MVILKTLYTPVRFSLAMRGLPVARRKTTFDVHLQYTTERMPSGNPPLHRPELAGGGLRIAVLPAGEKTRVYNHDDATRPLALAVVQFLCLSCQRLSPTPEHSCESTSSRLDQFVSSPAPGPPDRPLAPTVTSGVPTGQRRHANARPLHHVAAAPRLTTSVAYNCTAAPDGVRPTGYQFTSVGTYRRRHHPAP